MKKMYAQGKEIERSFFPGYGYNRTWQQVQ